MAAGDFVYLYYFIFAAVFVALFLGFFAYFGMDDLRFLSDFTKTLLIGYPLIFIF